MKPMSDQQRGDINLLLLADILTSADERHQRAGEPAYRQTVFWHPCGTPACAVGHWLAHQGVKAGLVGHRIPGFQQDFNIDADGWAYLFGFPPGHARTAADEADRIRAFVAARAEVTVS